MYPVRSRIVSNAPVFLAGADPQAELAAKMDAMRDEIKDRMIKAAYRIGAAQMGVQIYLMLLGPGGAILGSILSAVQFFAGRYYARKTKQVLEQAAQDIQTYMTQIEAEVNKRGEEIAAEEFPAASKLALSSDPLNGLGALGFDIGRSISRLTSPIGKAFSNIVENPTKKVLKVVAPVVVQPVRWSAKTLLRGAAVTTGTVGLKSVSNEFKEAEHATDNKAQGATKALSSPDNMLKETITTTTQVATGQPLLNTAGAALQTTGRVTGVEEVSKAGDQSKEWGKGSDALANRAGQTTNLEKTIDAGHQNIKSGAGMVTGAEQYEEAKKVAEKLRNEGIAGLRKIRDQALADLNKPATRAAIRKALAKQIREDPDALAEARALQAQEDALHAQQQAEINRATQAMNNSPEGGVDGEPKGKGAGILIGGGIAALAAAVAFGNQ